MASTTGFNEVATVPIEIIGHPVGPIVGSSTLEPLEVEVTAERAPHGIMENLRAAIGGPTAYDVTVSVRNRSTEVLDGVVLTGAAGRNRDDDLTDIEIPVVGTLQPGQTWEDTVRTTVPAPVIGGFVFHVTASGAGPTMRAEHSSSILPVGFLVVVAVLILDVGAIVWRRLAKRRARSRIELADDAIDAPAMPSGQLPSLA